MSLPRRAAFHRRRLQQRCIFPRRLGFASAALTQRRARTFIAAALIRPQDGKTPLDLVFDESYDDEDKRADNDAIRALLRNPPPN
jgi:hypothetical protein